MCTEKSEKKCTPHERKVQERERDRERDKQMQRKIHDKRNSKYFGLKVNHDVGFFMHANAEHGKWR